jgi:pimeloyl-ACP methyl ester carboxylesterase
VTTDWTTEATGTGQYVDLNGLHLYYEVHGSGRPLILIHGGLGSGEMFGPVIPALVSGGHQVIAPDLQAHGRTADIDRPLDIKLLADDVAALIRHLGLEKVDVMGYSLGGGTALFTAVKYPELVDRLVLVSVYLRPDVIDPLLLELQEQMGALTADAAEAMKDTPMYQLYERVAPRPEDFGRLLEKVGAMMGTPFDYTEDVRNLQVPTLLVAGDADQAPPAHYAEIFGLLGGGHDGGWMGENRPAGGHALAILPGLQHYNIFAAPLLAAAALSFLDAAATSTPSSD